MALRIEPRRRLVLSFVWALWKEGAPFSFGGPLHVDGDQGPRGYGSVGFPEIESYMASVKGQTGRKRSQDD